MRKLKGRRSGFHNKISTSLKNRVTATVLPLIFVITLVLTFYSSSSHLGEIPGSAALLSAQLTVPQGGGKLISQQLENLAGLLSQSTKEASSTLNINSSSSATSSSSSSSSSVSQVDPNSTVSAVSQPAAVSAAVASALKLVKTLQFGTRTGGEYETLGDICVYNQTAHHTADIKNQLAIKPDVKINLKVVPQVLIVHTHTTESYSVADTGTYVANAEFRTSDKSKSVVRVGDEIAKALQANGIGVIHDTTYNDYPEYTGAYDKSLAVIQSNMKKYPSIKVVLDIHRDTIQYTDGSRAKPTAVINGKKAAQLMIVSACNEAETSLSVPDWQYNYRFGLRIQQQLVKSYPGLARPLNLCPRRYNMQASHGSLLVEFGTDVNTLDEAIYAGQLFGQTLAQVLLGLQV